MVRIPCSACLLGNNALSSHASKCTCTYVERYRCTSCRFSTTNINIFKRHKINHVMASGSRFRCDKCGKNYLSQDYLIKHQKTQCGVEPKFQCPCCPYKCKTKGNLGSHVRRRHPDFQA